MKSLRIAVADDELDMRDYFQKILPRLGHRVVAVADNGEQLVEVCRTHQPDLVITDIRMPEMDGIDAAMEIYRQGPLPVILVSAHHDPGLIERAGQDHVFAYLVKPIKREDLETAIVIARSRFAQFETLRQEAGDLRQALADRKVIERAKGIMMKMTSLDEPAAFRRLQRLASEKNLKLVQIAQSILTANEALSPDEPD
jgi:response regulator NasT